MSEGDNKDSNKVYQFPEWAQKNSGLSRFSRKLRAIKEFGKRVATERGGNVGPTFWSEIKRRVEELKKDKKEG